MPHYSDKLNSGLKGDPVKKSAHLDPNDNVLVGARRFEQSPFRHLWETPETIMGVYAGRYYARHIGEDVEACYWNLRRKVMLYDVPERPVEISGPEVVPFLERIFTRRVSDLKLGRGRYAISCAHHGGLFIDGVLFRLEENRFWYVQPDGALETWLLAHSEGFNVTVTDPKSRVLQIQGPASLAVVHDLTEGAITEAMGYFHSGFFTVVRTRGLCLAHRMDRGRSATKSTHKPAPMLTRCGSASCRPVERMAWGSDRWPPWGSGESRPAFSTAAQTST
ncbi:hypothetical protein LNP02_28620 [Klebsiella variicola subsp. variicola]|nr:hypothetical protein [Klebsiella variicola subsp. variicola]